MDPSCDSSKGRWKNSHAMLMALKIDVDTYRGIAEGATCLAAYFHHEHIPASFFVTMGPDTSGRAALRVLKHRGFLKKMQRTSAIDVYGWRTVLSGTLWPPRPMAVSFSDRLRQWRDWGLEVSPHGYDHIRWHDQAAGWDERRAMQELEQTCDVYRHVFGDDPQSFAAPGWQAGWGTWKAMERLNLLYHSDTRGETPFYGRPTAVGPLPRGEGARSMGEGDLLRTLEIPTTLPTWDEMLAWDNVTPENLVERTWTLMRPDRLNVWTIHAEFEGTVYFSAFKQIVERARAASVQWVSLRSHAIAVQKERAGVPACAIEQGQRPGRAGTVTCQGK